MDCLLPCARTNKEESEEMKKQWKRMLAGALSCVLALSLLPAAASAAEPEPVYQGDGYYITVELYGNQDLRVMTS